MNVTSLITDVLWSSCLLNLPAAEAHGVSADTRVPFTFDQKLKVRFSFLGSVRNSLQLQLVHMKRDKVCRKESRT